MLFYQTSMAKLVFKLKIFFASLTKRATLMRRSTVLSLLLQLVFPEAVFLVVCDPFMNKL
jgi:hypothetical protein